MSLTLSRRLGAGALTTILALYCALARPDPLIIQPVQGLALAVPNQGSVAVHGSFILVGEPGAGDSPAGSGVVDVYAEQHSGPCDSSPCWILQTRLQRQDALTGDAFGQAVAFDGRTLLIGSPAAEPGREAAFVYGREGDHFVFRQALQGDPLNPSPGGLSYFGVAVAVHRDRLAVTELPEFFEGAAYVFRRDSHRIWQREAKLQPANESASDQYGVSVDLNRHMAIVGADLGGYASIFRRQGRQWQETQTLIPWDTLGGSFGRSVDLRAGELAVGAYTATNPSAPDGAIYVFDRQTGIWMPEQKLIRPGQPDTNFFGMAVRIRGNRLAAFSPEAIYLFEHRAGQWTEVAQLVAPELFGALDSLAVMDWDGSTLAAMGTTHVWVFDLSPAVAGP